MTTTTTNRPIFLFGLRTMNKIVVGIGMWPQDCGIECSLIDPSFPLLRRWSHPWLTVSLDPVKGGKNCPLLSCLHPKMDPRACEETSKHILGKKLPALFSAPTHFFPLGGWTDRIVSLGRWMGCRWLTAFLCLQFLRIWWTLPGRLCPPE